MSRSPKRARGRSSKSARPAAPQGTAASTSSAAIIDPLPGTSGDPAPPIAPPGLLELSLGRDPLVFTGIAVGALVGLLALRPVAEHVVGPSVRTVANALVQDTTFGTGGHVWFTPADPKDKPANRSEPLWDMFAWIKNDMNTAEGRRLLSSTRAFYTPDCAYAALAVALPFRSWTRRRGIAVVLGFAALQMALFAGLMLALIEDMSDPSSPLKVYDFSGFTLDVLNAAVGSLEHRLGMAYLLALVFWLVALFAGTPLGKPGVPRRISAG